MLMPVEARAAVVTPRVHNDSDGISRMGGVRTALRHGQRCWRPLPLPAPPPARSGVPGAGAPGVGAVVGAPRPPAPPPALWLPPGVPARLLPSPLAC